MARMSPRHLWLAAMATTMLASVPGHAETIAITGGTLLTQGPLGEVRDGTVVIEDGRIQAVGAGIPIPAGARVIDAKGGIVTPGFVNPASSNGLSRPSSYAEVPSTDDMPLAAEIHLAFDPGNVDVLEGPVDGATTAVLMPTVLPSGMREGKNFAGSAAAVALSGAPDSLIRKGLGPVFSVKAATSLGGREAAFPRLVRQLRDARAAVEGKAAGQPDRPGPDIGPLKAVVNRTVPLLVDIDSARDIAEILRIAREENIRVVLLGAAEGWVVAAQIAQARVPVVISDANLPLDFDTLRSTYQNAARLKAAGVTIALAGEGILGPSPRTGRSPRYVAGRSVAYGLDHASALAGVTIVPARIYGLDGELGSIEVGKRADIVVWGGDPLEVTSFAEHVFIAGVEPPRPRAALLRDKYKVLLENASTGTSSR